MSWSSLGSAPPGSVLDRLKAGARPRHSAGRGRAVESLEGRRLFTVLTWVGDIDGNWGSGVANVNTNWSPNVLPANGDTLVFDSGAPRNSVNNMSNLVLDGVRINGLSSTNTRYSITGNAVTFSGSQAIVFNAPNDPTFIGPRFLAPIRLAAPTVVSNSGTGLATLGPIDLNGNALTFTADAGNVAAGSPVSGSGGIVKNGSKMLTFSVANSYTGTTQVNQGSLRLQSTGTLGAAGADNPTVISDGANLRIESAGLDLAESIFVSGDGGTIPGVGPLGAIRNTADCRLSGPVTLTGDAKIATEAGTLAITGLLSGNHDLTKFAQGTLVLSNPANTLGNPDVRFPNHLVITDGVLRTAAANVLPSQLLVNVSVTGALDLDGYDQTITLLGASAPVRLGAATLTIKSPLIQGSNASGTISGTGGVTIAGWTQQDFSGPESNTYSGTTVVTGNSYLFLYKSAGATAVAGDLVIGGSGGGTVDYFGADAEQIADTSAVSVNAGGTLDLRGVSETIGSLSGTAGGKIKLGVPNAAGTLTVAGPDSDAYHGAIEGAGGLTKTGLGSLALAGVNTYTGPTTIHAGTLYVNGSQAASPVVMDGGVLAGAGTVGSVNATGGTIWPSLSAVSILHTGNVQLAPAAALGFGLVPGAGIDRLDVAGTVALGGARLDIAADPYFDPLPGMTMVLVSNDGVDAISGTFAGLPEGSYLAFNGLSYRLTYTGGTGNDVVLIREDGPAVASGAFELATSQRLAFRFTQNVNGSVDRGDLTLVNLTTNTPVDVATLAVAYSGGSNTATFTRTGPPLPDGNYRAVLNGAGIKAVGTGISIGAITTFDFFVLAGDADHNRTVGPGDFSVLASNFGKNTRTFPDGDFDYDGTVGPRDFNLLAGRFGMTLAPPAPGALLGQVLSNTAKATARIGSSRRALGAWVSALRQPTPAITAGAVQGNRNANVRAELLDSEENLHPLLA